MNDKEFEIAKRRISTIAKRWIHDMGLGWYEIGIDYKMGDAPTSYTGVGIAPFSVVSRWQYRYATITVYVEEIPEDDEKLEKAIVHELCHILVNPMRCPDHWDKDREEYVVSCLASSFLWVREKFTKSKV